MQYSIVNKSILYRHLRIDAEFYRPEYTEIEKLLKTIKGVYPLRKYCHYIKKGIFDISPELYVNTGVPLLRTSEIKDALINFSTTVFLDEKTHIEHQKTELRKGDIVLTKIGAYIGDVALLPNRYDTYNFSQNVTGLKIKQNQIKSSYLLAFLLSKYGNIQIQRVIMLSGQGKIELEDIRDLQVVEGSVEFQGKIDLIVEQAQDFIQDSETYYHQAEVLLLSELGLLDWRPKHALSFVRNYSETQQAGRFDAEYFYPKYDEIVKTIKNYKGGWDTLENQFKQNKQGFRKDDEKEYTYLEIGGINISSGEIKVLKLLGKELPANAKIRLSKDDLVVSKVRTYRGAVAIIERDNIIGSGAFTVLREAGEIKKETLFVLLKSLPYLEFSLKFNTGTSYPVIVDGDILNYPFPLVKSSIQSRICQKITESFRLRKQSKHLLECAKKAVEMAIEKNEKTATQWLQKQTQNN